MPITVLQYGLQIKQDIGVQDYHFVQLHVDRPLRMCCLKLVGWSHIYQDPVIALSHHFRIFRRDALHTLRHKWWAVLIPECYALKLEIKR